nr:retrovirus-related Pol polyprotein from transposon TNT 1-94 [Tanacetum cinerariifolium]
NKKDERGIVVKNKASLVGHGYTQEERIDYDEVFALVARIESIRLFLAYVSFKDFVVYQMDVKSAFLYGKIEEEVYVCQPLGFEDLEFPDRVYKVTEFPEKQSRVSSKEDDKDDQDLRDEFKRLIQQEKNGEHDVNSTNNINTVSLTVNIASIKDNVVDKNIVYGCADDTNMPNLEEIVYSDDDEDVGAEANMTNLDTNIPVSPILTTRIHKDHSVEQIIRDIHLAPQTRRMTKM